MATHRPPILVGHASRVEICDDGAGVVLWVGAVSIRLDLSAAQDVASMLEHAVVRCGQARPPALRGPSDDPSGQRDEWDVPTLPEPFAPTSH